MNGPAFGRNRRSESKKSARTKCAFTIVELLVAMAVLAIILIVTFTIMGQMTTVWKGSSSKIESFQGARLAFESMTRLLSQVTLNTYVDYDNATTPTNYLRKSDLSFLSGPAGGTARGGVLPGTTGCGQAVFFAAPGGNTANWASYGSMDGLLNVCGFYVSFTINSSVPAHVTSPNPYRYRLMQLTVPTESANGVYPSNPAPSVALDWTNWFAGTSWFSNFIGGAVPIADNVILLLVRPQDPSNPLGSPPSSADINPDYTYDTALNATTYPQPVTANQLPPVIQITMVAIDETSAIRLNNGSSQPPAIAQALSNKFTLAANYSTDLTNLENALEASHIQYRIFSSAVPVLETKWSK
jgi:uncharacterized protein (TIGR02599 family)